MTLPINKIICGDCLEVMKDWPDNCVDLVVTDIPYDGVNRESGGLRKLNKGNADIATFELKPFLSAVMRISRGSGYVFCGWGQISEIVDIFRQQGLSNRLFVWKKTNPSPMNGQYLWLSGIEMAVYFKNHNATFNMFCANCVVEFPSGKSKVHPTQKPLRLFDYLIRASSNKNNLVIDPCVGSGTTCVAAKMLGRRYIGIDISEEYCQIARMRIKAVETGVSVKEQRAGQMGLFAESR